MGRTFIDDVTEGEFRKRGYVVRPFLDEEEVASLQQLHGTLPPEAPTDFYASVFSRSAEYRRRVSEGIESIIKDKLESLLPHHELAFGMFVTKRPKTTTATLPLHRDYAFVDSAIHTGANLWCPLIDVDERNGCLHVIEGSHRLMEAPFAVNEYPSPFHPVRALLEAEFSTKLPMAAGSTVVYDSRLLHGSGENTSSGSRSACVCILVPKGVAPKLYVWNGREPTRFDVFEVTKEFLFEMERGAPIEKPYPEGVRYLGSTDYPVTPLEPSDLDVLRRIS